VGGQEDRLTAVREAPDQDAEFARAYRVEPDRRLVEEQDVRIVEQPASQVQPLLHASRVALHLVVLAARKPKDLQQLCDSPF
jgi:hypothetical protein